MPPRNLQVMFTFHTTWIYFFVKKKSSLSMPLIQILLDLTAISPINGFEMSVVLEKYCNNFIYPTPYDLHFSNAHLQGFSQNLEEYCKAMNGTDKDLAAHFTVINKVGITIYGKEISDVFGNVPKEAYLDSIKFDVNFDENEIADHPVYVILNLCRVVAFIEENIVTSKEQGGIWGVKNIAGVFSTLIQNAPDVYCHNKELSIANKSARSTSQATVSLAVPGKPNRQRADLSVNPTSSFV